MIDMSGSKDAIIAAAMLLFKERGYDRVSVSDICARAETSRNTFYYYFASKEDLLLEWAESYAPDAEAIRADVLSMSTPLQRLLRLNRRSAERFLNIGVDLTRQYLKAYISGNNSAIVTQHASSTLFQSLVKSCQANGSIRNRLPAERLEFASARMMFGILMEWCANPSLDLVGEQFRASLVFFDVPDRHLSEVWPRETDV